jgi:hypothetical protein
MAYFRLPDHLGVCEVDGQVLMLDLRRDRYLALDSGAARAMRRWRDGSARLEEDPELDRLLHSGMLMTTTLPQLDRWRACAVPRRSLLDIASLSPRSGLPALPEVAASLWQARILLKRRGLEHAVRQCRPAMSVGTTDPLLHVAAFRAARRLLPTPPNCLADSLALSRFLSRRNVASVMVFGVKLDPFAAHCWLQQDDVILNDAADAVATFTPIMAV